MTKMKWLYDVKLDEVVKNTREVNKVTPKEETEKSLKVINAINSFPASMRGSIKVLLEEATGEKYPDLVPGEPKLNTLVMFTHGLPAGIMGLVTTGMPGTYTNEKVVAHLSNKQACFLDNTRFRYLRDEELDEVVSWFEVE